MAQRSRKQKRLQPLDCPARTIDLCYRFVSHNHTVMLAVGLAEAPTLGADATLTAGAGSDLGYAILSAPGWKSRQDVFGRLTTERTRGGSCMVKALSLSLSLSK